MSLVTLVPDSTVYNGGVLTGGSPLHAVLADASSASYVTKAQFASPDKVSTTTPTKPAGSVTKQVRLYLGASSISASSTRIDAWIEMGGVQYGTVAGTALSGTTDTAVYGPWTNVGDLSATAVGDLVVAMQRAPTGGVTSCRFYTQRLEVIFAEIPTTVMSAPTEGGTLTVSSFSAVWTHTPGSEGGAQSHYIARLYNAAQYGAPGFDPDVSTALSDSFVVASSSSSHAFTGVPSGTYRVYAKTAQSINGAPHWAAWDWQDFTVSLTTSEVSTVTPTPDSLNGAVIVDVAINAATDTADYVEVERAEDTNLFTSGDFTTGASGIGTGWVVTFDVGTPTSTSRSLQTTDGISGQYQRLVATLNAGDAFGVAASQKVPITPGEGFSVQFAAKGTTPPYKRLRCSLVYRNQSGALSAGWLTYQDQAPTSAWNTFAIDRVAGADHYTVEIWFEIVGLTGAGAAVTTGDIDLVRVFPDGLREWTPVRGATSIPVVSDAMSVADFEAPPDVPVPYRARAVKSTGPVVGAWVTSAATEWSPVEGVWIKSPFNPNLNIELCPTEWPDPDENRQTNWLDVLGVTPYYGVSNSRKGYSGSFTFEAATAAELTALLAVLAEPTVLIHSAAGYRLRPFYASLGRVSRQTVGLPGSQLTMVSVEYVEVAAP